MPPTTYTYKAFISYSHAADGRLAPALQSALHRFAKPWYKLRALRVFRDQTNLAANPHLWSEIQKALEQSEYFLLLASPLAAKSKWVRQELTYWLDKRDPGKLLLVLTDGVMVWNAAAADFDWTQTTALPDVFRGKFHLEPLYVDLTFAKGSTQLSTQHPEFLDRIATIAATLHDRSKDEIFGEDLRQQRRTWRLVRAIAAVLTLLLVVAVWLYLRADTAQIAAVASEFDTATEQHFAAAQALDLQQQIEYERYRKMKEEFAAQLASVVRNRGDSVAATRVRLLGEELAQQKGLLHALRERAKNARLQAVSHLRSADEHWESLQALGRRLLGGTARVRTRPAVPGVFSIEVLNISQGESLILHYGTHDNPRFILIDGGVPGQFKARIAPRLNRLRDRWYDTAPLELDLVIVSHSDFDRIDGINELTDSLLADQQAGKWNCTLHNVWYNDFPPAAPAYQKYHFGPQKRARKYRLASNLLRLQIPVNKPFDYSVVRPSGSAVRVALPDGLTVTVLHPTTERLEEYRKYLTDLWRRREDASKWQMPAVPAESYTDPKLTLVRPGNGEPLRPLDKGGTDFSIPNQSSLVLMFEYAGKRFLYTGDANDFEIMEGLHLAGYLDAQGKTHVDLMHIPHQGSDRNVSLDFFRRVTADSYLITGGGRHGNPEPATLHMLTSARQNQLYTLFFTHRVGVQELQTRLDAFFAESPAGGSRYRRVFRFPGDDSLIVNLLNPVRY